MHNDSTLDRQLDLEDRFNKHNIDKIILNQIDTTDKLYQDTKWHVLMECSDMLEDHDLGLDDITNALWIEILRNPQEKHIQSIGTLIGNRFGLQGLASIAAGTRVLEAAAHLDLYNMIIFDRSKIIRPMLKLDTDTLTTLDNLMYQPPMVCKPNDWTSNRDGGWLSVDKHCVLGKGNSHGQRQNLDYLNKLQSIPWVLDPHIMFNFSDGNEYKGDNALFLDYMNTPFYFVWRYDKRGRGYSEGYNINLQSNEYRRAMISMDHSEVVTPEGMDWLKVAVANTFGHDKATFSERIAWFESQDDFFIDCAEEPILAAKFLKAYQDAEDGESVRCNMFLDATASGIQIMAALSNCFTTAKAVNMVGDEREDIYGEVATVMNQFLDTTDAVCRDDTKKPVMTHYYNSIEGPKRNFNDAQIDAFYSTLNGAFEGAQDVLESINLCWSDDAEFAWTLPDGHRAVIRSKVTEGTTVPLIDTDFYYEYTAYKPSGNSRHLAPNIIHSIDGWIAREMVRRCPFPLAHIHDAFTAHPNNMGVVCDTYNVLLAEICDSNLLQDILREITGDKGLVYNKLGSSLSEEVLISTHTLS
jgi:hypothetical protein